MKTAIPFAALSIAVCCQTAIAANTDEESIEKINIYGTKTPTLQEEFAGSATVLGEDFTKAFDIKRLRDLDAFVPNMQISQLGQMGGSFISFRGISSNPFVVNRASVYIDGIPYREINNQLLNNIAQIEVLKGPQGTLYGSNTEAGVIVINSNRPSEDTEVNLSMNHYWHGNGKNQEMSASIAGSVIGDSLLGRVSTSVHTGDAFVINTQASDDELGKLREHSVQTDLYWHVNDDSFVRFLAMFESNQAPGLYEQEFVPSDLSLYNRLYGGQNNGATLGELELAHDVEKNTDEKEYFIAISSQMQFDNFTLDGSFSYQDGEDDSSGVDLEMTALPLFRGATKRKREAVNGELRLSHNGEFSWMIGINFFNEKKSQSLGFQNLMLGQTALAFEPAQFKESKDVSAFATVSFEPMEDWQLEFGGRFEKSTQSIEQDTVVLLIPGVGALESPAQQLQKDYHQFLPKIALSKRFENAGMLYTSASKGWLPGGFNLAAARQTKFTDFTNYDNESLWHYELGYKLNTLNGRLFSSIALFYIDADNWQEYSVVTDKQGRVASTNLVTSNGDVVSKGIEVEWRYTVNQDLFISGGIGANDAYYKSYQFSDDQDYSGNDIPLTPNYDASLAAQYEIGDNWYVNTHLNFLGNSSLNTANSTRQDAYALVSLRVGYQTSDWSLEVYSDNLTNRRHYSGLSYDNFIYGTDGLFYAPAGEPRQIGIRFDWMY